MTLKVDFIKLLKFIKSFKAQWIPYSLTTIMVAFRNFLITYLTAFVSSKVVSLAQHGYNYDFKNELIYFIIILICFVIFDAVGVYGQTMTIQKMMCNLKLNMYEKIMKAKLSDLDTLSQRSEVIGRINSDVDTASSLLSWGILAPLMYFISGIGATVILASFNIMLCLIIYFVGIITLAINIVLSRISRKLLSQTREETTSVLSVYTQSVSNSALIKTESLSAYVKGVFRNILKKILQLSQQQSKVDAISGGVGGIVQFFSYFGIIFISILLTINNMSIADIVMVSQVGSLIVSMITSISSSLTNLQRSFVGIDRIFMILELEDEEQNEGDKFEIINESLIKAKNLHCKINNTVIFDNLNFDLHRHHLVALTGKSGKGKSTLLRLLLKLYGYSGSLKLMGSEISKTSTSSLRENIAYVTQSNLIFKGSIKDNLLKGNRRTDITQEEIDAVLRMVCAYEWVNRKDDMLNTELSEGGMSLSGGQRQMIGIARALLMKKKLLFFDEAFAGVDDENISKIMCNLKAMEGSDIIIVTHDKRIMDMCDAVISLS